MIKKQKTIDDKINSFEKEVLELENRIRIEVNMRGTYSFEIKEKYRNNTDELTEKFIDLKTHEEVYMNELDLDDFVDVTKQYLLTNTKLEDAKFSKLEKDIDKLYEVEIHQNLIKVKDAELDLNTFIKYKSFEQNKQALQVMKQATNILQKVYRAQTLRNIENNSTYVFRKI